jgi:PAS domain S-box-containing protein
MAAAKVLVVEDEGIEALDIQQRLIRLGYCVPVIALSGEEALQKVEETGPDLVLMDIMLHGALDGVEAAAVIQARFDIPVIYLTAYADEDTLQRAKTTVPYGYIVKPFQERELQITIEMALYKHKMERKLKESEKWFSTTLRSIGDAVITTDRNGNVSFLNPVAESLLGWKLDEVANVKLTEIFKIINRDSRRPVENPVTKVLANGHIVGLANHTILIARDGTEIPIDDSAAPIKDDQGNIIGVVLVFRDITEREKAEEALRRAYDELEERVRERTVDLELTNQQLKKEIEQRSLAEERLQEQNIELENACLAKDRFLANMSHELRTPLNAVIGFTGTLLMKLPGPLTEEQEKQLQNISTSAKHLLSLINDLLDLAKIESGKVQLNLEPVSCRAVIEEVAATLQSMAESKGLRLLVDIPDQDPMVNTDRRALSQILLNLVHNAIKFTEKGAVRLELRCRIKDGFERVEFDVIDTGIGIKPEEQARLFQAFTQVEPSGLHSYDGAGLGLHLSKKLADLLNGRIIFQSEYGKGSKFTLIIASPPQ